MTEDADYTIRPADWAARGERNWVCKCWVACDRATPQARHEGPSYMRRQQQRIDDILSRAETLVLVAENAFDGRLDGFSVREGPGRLWYVYVRRIVQRVGLGRRLCIGLGPEVAYHHTPLDKAMPIPAGWRFEPRTKDKAA
jgi:hypothetical protein